VIGATLTPTVAVALAFGTVAPTEADADTGDVMAGRTTGAEPGVADGVAGGTTGGTGAATDAASVATGSTAKDGTETEIVGDAAGATAPATLTGAAAMVMGATTGDGTEGTTTGTGAGMATPSAAALDAHETATAAADSGIARHRLFGAPIDVLRALCKGRRNPLSPWLFIRSEIVARCRG
jgi:hypothetical protein